MAPPTEDARTPARSPDGDPNPVLHAVANAVTSLRADDDMAELLQVFDSLHPQAIEKLDPATARRQPTIADAVKALLDRQGRASDPASLVPGVTSRDIAITATGGALPARVYTPAGTGPFPVVVFFHGGGWVIADKQVYDGGARGIAHAARAVVVSVDYRQAPEHRFPTAWTDAIDAYAWVLAHAAELNGDAKRVALAGESAGGNLAVATAVAARDAGLPAPVHVLAVYPVAQTSLNTESELANAIARPLNRAMVKWFVDHLVRSPDDLKDTRLKLIEADLRGLPPVTLINARIDPLRSDGAKLEDALRTAGVPVERRDYDGVTHEFFGTAAVVQKARDAQAWAGERLRGSFGNL